MKVKVLSRNPDNYLRQTKRDIHKVPRNYDPSLHPFEAPREYIRALNATKLERVFAKPFLGSLEGHKDSVQCMAKHPSSLSKFLSGACDGQVKLWNLANQHCVSTVQAHDGFVNGVCVVPGGDSFLTCGTDQTIKLWSMTEEGIIKTEPESTILGKDVYQHIDHSYGQDYFATCGQQVDLWNLERAEPLKTFTWGTDGIYALKFNQIETNLLACCASDRSIMLYDMRGTTPLRKVIMKLKSNAVAWNPMEAFIFTVANEDYNLYTFDMRKLERPLKMHKDHVSAVLDVDYSPTGKEFVSGSFDKSIRIFPVDSMNSRYMQRKKEQGSVKKPTPSTKPQTRNMIETRREYNRQKKRKEREEMSWQKKMWVRKKDRERKQKKRKEEAAKLIACSTPKRTVESPIGSPFTSKKTEYNITSKVRKSLPKSPTKFAKVVDNLLSTVSPRKVEALSQMKTLNSSSKVQHARKALKQVLKSSKSSSVIKLALSVAKKYRTRHSACKGRKMKRKSHVDGNSVQRFFLREDISRVLPGKRYATREGPGYAMQVSLKAAYSKYQAENPTKQVSFGKFAALRPKNVRLLRVSDREFCCCVYCINVRYKMLCLSRALVDTDKKKTCETDVLDIMLCPKRDGQRYHKPDCINGKCSDCKNYMDTLNQYYGTIPDDKQLSWTRWEHRETENGKRKRMVVTKRGKKQECLEEFLEHDLKRPVQGTSYFQHIHTAHWQIAQFNQIKNHLPTGDILQVMDFAKNREVKYQDEIKGAYYTAGQITMHPIITYYKSDTGLVRNASIVISEDNEHDHFSVQHFQEIVYPEIEKKLGDCKPNRKIIFSDGCSSQYKSKGPFAELAGSRDVINRNYFGSEHGKSECDAEMGVVNRCVDRAIVANQAIINNAQDLYQYCKKNLESDSPFSKRTFHLVKSGEIDRVRSDIMKPKTVQDTRKIHQIVNLQTGNTFKARNLSCFCMKCEAGSLDCLNSKYVNSYKEKTLLEQTKSIKSRASGTKKSTSEKPKADKARQPKENTKAGKKVKQSEESPETGQSEKTNAENERQQYFSSLLTMMELSGSNGFEQLKEVCSVLHIEINDKYPLETTDSQFSFESGKYTADQIAQTLIPEEISNRGMLPVNVMADGNCLPRTGSILLFGDESAHEEMRVRIAIELCLNLDLYIDNSYLNRGENFPAQESKVLAKTYTMFSEQYVPGSEITKSVTEEIFKEETVKICKRSEYMGIWQLFALSSVLQKKISSVYPNIGSSCVVQVLNRNILPRQGDKIEQSVTVMWTSTRMDMEPQNWIPNHFVPILPIVCLPYLSDTIEDPDMSDMIDNVVFSEEDAYLSLNDTLMDTILDTLSSSIHTPEGTPIQQGPPERIDESPGCPGRCNKSPKGPPGHTDRSPEGTPGHADGSAVDDDGSYITQIDISDEPPGCSDECPPGRSDIPEFPDCSNKSAECPGRSDESPKCPPGPDDESVVDDNGSYNTQIDNRYKSGEYIIVKHGKCFIPAVVDSWPWVKFFKKGRQNMWTLNDTKHTVLSSDVDQRIPPPDITTVGTRLLYHFAEAGHTI